MPWYNWPHRGQQDNDDTVTIYDTDLNYIVQDGRNLLDYTTQDSSSNAATNTNDIIPT